MVHYQIIHCPHCCGTDLHKNGKSLKLQDVTVVDTVDFSDQALFDGIPTVFTVMRNGEPARVIHYKITNGLMTFRDTGHYEVTMTNTAIVSRQDFPAKVIVEITVLPKLVGIAEPEQEKIKIFPNPTTGKLKVEIAGFPRNDGADVAIYDIFGRPLLSLQSLSSPETEIDISHLQSGIYIIKINNITKKFIKY